MVQTVDILGVPHAYELTPPKKSACVLVFVHGWLLSREYWKPLISQLAPDYQCLSYDLRGFGASQARSPERPASISTASSRRTDASTLLEARGDRNTFSLKESARYTSPYTPAAYADDLTLMLEALGIESAWVVGHSLGGSIALWASEKSPQRVKGVFCVNSGGGIYLKEEFEKFRSAGQQLIKFRPRWLCYLPLIDVMMTRMNVARSIDRKWGRQRLIDLVIAQAEAALGTLMDSTTEEEVHNLPRLVSRLQQPVYFITGADDDIMEPKYVKHLASFHSSFECMGQNVCEIENCGHLAMVEQPEKVAEHMRQILTKHGYGTATGESV